MLKIVGKLDLQVCLDSIDLSHFPGNDEVELVMRKRLTKNHLIMQSLNEATAIENGDTVQFSVTSEIPRYNKQNITVVVGAGLYSREVEASMIGHYIGDTYSVFIDEAEARITIASAKRKSVPEITDEMAAAMEIPGVATIEQYRQHLKEFMILDAVISLGAEVTIRLNEQVEIEIPSEDIKRKIALCDYNYLSSFHRNEIASELKISPDEISEEQLRQYKNYGNFEEFYENQSFWFQLKAQNCALLSAALGVELKGDLDPFTEYEALDRLQSMLNDIILDYASRRKNDVNC